MGIVAAAGSVGGACFPIILARLTDLKTVGYSWSLRVVAVIVTYVRFHGKNNADQSQVMLHYCDSDIVHEPAQTEIRINKDTI